MSLRAAPKCRTSNHPPFPSDHLPSVRIKTIGPAVIRYLLALCCLLPTIGGGFLRAQEGPRIRNITPEEYQARNQNWAFAQDERGTLYAANSGGILRYDGARWSQLQLPGGPIVRSVLVVGDRLYAGGYGEFGYFTGLGGENPTYVSLSERLPDGGRLREEIWHIAPLPDGTVIFQSFAALFVHDDRRVYRVQPPGIMMFARVRGAELLVPVTGQGIYRWRPGADFRLLPGTEALGEQRVAGIVVGAGTDLLIATQYGGIYEWTNERLRPWTSAVGPEGYRQRINRFTRLRDGTLAVGTILAGLYLLHPDGTLATHSTRDNGLQNNTVLALHEDRAGDLWLGLDRGIDLVLREGALRHFTSDQQAVGAVYAAARYDGRFYLGTNQGVFVRPLAEPRTPFVLVPGTQGQVWELRPTPNGLLCGHNEGTFLLRGDRAELISPYSGGWQTLPPAGDSTCWLQASYTGLVRLSFAGGSWTAHYLPDFVAPLRSITWVGPRTLLALHNARGGYRLELTPDYRGYRRIDTLAAPELVQPFLGAFAEGPLIQTREQYYTTGPAGLEPVDHWRGLDLTPPVRYLPGRAQRREWFAVGDDRVTFYRDTQRVAEFPLRMPADYPKIIAWGDSAYLFCTDEGYAILAGEPPSAPPPPVYIAAAYRADGAWVPLADTSSAVRILPYRNNHLRVRFGQPLYDRAVRFRYRLRGYSEQWSEWSSLSEREFTNLPEGTYRLEVAGDWSDRVANWRFRIRPPWYRSAAAYAIYLLLLPCVAYLLYRLHRRRLANQARLLEIKRERELQRQRILARNRQLQADNLRKSEELANSTLNLAKKNEMLLGLKEELKTTSRRQGETGHNYQRLLHLIDRQLGDEEDWAIFESHFNEVHAAFLKRLCKQHPELTPGELKLSAYLRMNLSSKEIAPLLHISVRGVENKRYRLRKKLHLDGDDSLNAYLMEF